MLEPDEAKVSRPVFRGLGAGNSPRLPGLRQEVAFNNVWLDPTCCITSSFLPRHALPVMVLCEARMTMKPLALCRERESRDEKMKIFSGDKIWIEMKNFPNTL
jgi:hypothetical protein